MVAVVPVSDEETVNCGFVLSLNGLCLCSGLGGGVFERRLRGARDCGGAVVAVVNIERAVPNDERAVAGYGKDLANLRCLTCDRRLRTQFKHRWHSRYGCAQSD